MISNLTLKNFKCFREQSFPLKPLTVLSGTNGAGKSSVIQSLLLLRALKYERRSTYLPLNGIFGLELGTVGDILCQTPQKGGIEIVAEHQGGIKSRILASAEQSKLDDRFFSLSQYFLESTSALNADRTFRFAYLAADRLGPRDNYSTQSAPKAFGSIDSRGEFTAQILAENEREPIGGALVHQAHDKNSIALLRQQIELWMGEWIPGIQIRVETFPGTNIAILRFQRGRMRSEWMRPTNMGFGISHSLPILVAGMLANKGGLFIVDSPESHLHPAGQSAIGKFLATVASTGVQVVVETHSDHVMNGIRLTVKRGVLKHSDVSILYFSDNCDALHKVDNPQIDEHGRIPEWPNGFFDQAEKDLIELV